ncbi:MAG: SH3 domain-containing protein [Desulfobulbaceae bacterium]|nr:SH3 domain-containing protein [Desulfobulbaceae bacterium]
MKSHTFFVLTIILSLLSAPLICLGSAEIVSKGISGDRYVFKVNGVMVVVSPGDMIDDCLVTVSGLKCGEGELDSGNASEDILGEVLKLKIDKRNCEESLYEVERECRKRYEQNIEELTSALKKRNFDLADKVKELEAIKKDLYVNEILLAEYGLRIQELTKAESTSPPAVQEPLKPEITVAKSVNTGKMEAQSPESECGIAPKAAQAVTVKAEAVTVTAPRPRKIIKYQAERTGLDGQKVKMLVVEVNWSNIRREPVVDSDIVTQGLAGDVFRIIDSVERWFKVETDGGGTGWISADLVKPHFTPQSSVLNKVSAVRVNEQGNARVRTGPGFHFKTKGVALGGKRYDTGGRTYNWHQIIMKDGSRRWVHKSTVVPE